MKIRAEKTRKKPWRAVAAFSFMMALVAVVISFHAFNDEEGRESLNMLPLTVTLYRTSTCSCCAEYEKYLKENGIEVKTIIVEQQTLADLAKELETPPKLLSCHTSVVEEYIVEGHVPIEAIFKLLNERPEVDGIALPGMPKGAPGMGGARTTPLQIYAWYEGSITLFMEL